MNMAEKLIGEEEGREKCAYRDNLGYLSIAIGCLVDKSQPGAGLCDAAIDAQFEHDQANAERIAAHYPYFAELNEVRQAVLISMSFQMSTKPQLWPHFMQCLARRDYSGAAAAGRDSEWCKVQTHGRAEREMKMLESGEWVDYDPSR